MLYAHERSLVKQYEGKPFVLVGVNTDRDRDDAEELRKKGIVTWRSWWDRSMDGPISTRWGIQRFPTIMLIDAKGVLRYQGPHGNSIAAITSELDAEIAKLVKEAE